MMKDEKRSVEQIPLQDHQRQHSREYQALLDNIPGGVQQCMNDPFYTIIEVNQGFLDLLGYSREELSELFENRYINMIYPDDRQFVSSKVAASLTKGGKCTINYRVCCKGGGIKWVMDNSQLTCSDRGEEVVFCVLTDITDSRDTKEELRLSMERYQIIMDQATDVIFDWDIRNDTMYYSGNWEKKFGYIPHYEGLENQDVSFRNIHPDDVPALREAMLLLLNGQGAAQTEVRVQNAQGQYCWCRFRATQQYDGDGRPFRAVGLITDIDKDKKMINDLRRRAERDALTGLYNRAETELQISRYLEGQPKELCALYMIDTDNFKQVNDSQGHYFGDAVLSEIAAGMRKLTRQTDVVGRIGGDEFAVFLKNISSRDMAVKKAESMIQMFRSLFSGDRKLFEVSCSVGVSVYPEDGEDFPSLYRSADQALYQAKSRGKNQYIFADKEAVLMGNQGGYSSIGTAIDSDTENQELPENLVNYVFQILYDTRDIRKSIQMILELVGRRFDVSRAYIFEDSVDGKYTSNTFEWCNDGIAPYKDHLQNLSYEEFQNYKSQFKDNSILYCRDIHSLGPELASLLKPQGVCSLLHCAITNNGKFHGFVGFDECTGLRMWTKEEISMLSLVSQLITTFLLKTRASERDEALSLQLNTILDSQDAFIYAIEQSSYRILYLNQKTVNLGTGAVPGMTCYQAFFDREKPCGNCPLGDGSGEIYNPRYDIWSKVRVSSLKWGITDAYLLSCFDITEYKRILEGDRAGSPPA